MPVEKSPRFANERLAGDSGGPQTWDCPACFTQQVGDPAQGCQHCGAGKPGEKGKLPPTLEELEARRQPSPAAAPRPAARGGAVDSLFAALDAPAPSAAFTLEDVRQVIREELRGKGTPSYTEPEQVFILDAIALMQRMAVNGKIAPEHLERYPSVEDMELLWQRIQGGE